MDKMLQAHFYGEHQPYEKILHKMKEIHESVAKGFLPNQLMLLEHEPVITITKQHQERSVKTSKEAIVTDGIDLIEADRGGDATFHGPGQIVGYPIINLKSIGAHNFDAGSYVRKLEQALLKACFELGVKEAILLDGFSGIWLRMPGDQYRKLIAIGVGLKNGATKHGFAFNVSIDYQKYSKHIIPCGLKDKGVISLKEILEEKNLKLPDSSVILSCLMNNIAKIFGLILVKKENLKEVTYGSECNYATTW